MILYFSATGNSKAVAQLLSEKLHDISFNIAQNYNNEELIKAVYEEETALGFVFPVYGWNIPDIIYTFFEKLSGTKINARYTFFVVTCGDDVGIIDKQIIKLTAKTGLPCNAIFSVTMPNIYVCLPGFDVDNEETVNVKLSNYPERINDIANLIKTRKNIILIKRGIFPRIKTYVLGTIFKKILIKDKYFHTNSDCTSCSACVKVCPTKNITIKNNHTVTWNNHCIGCLSCYHHCPVRAIRYGLFTKSKGQYLFNKYTKK